MSMPSILHLNWFSRHVVNFHLGLLNLLAHFISFSYKEVTVFIHRTSSFISSFDHLLFYMDILLYTLSLILFSLPFICFFSSFLLSFLFPPFFSIHWLVIVFFHLWIFIISTTHLYMHIDLAYKYLSIYFKHWSDSIIFLVEDNIENNTPTKIQTCPDHILINISFLVNCYGSYKSSV